MSSYLSRWRRGEWTAGQALAKTGELARRLFGLPPVDAAKLEKIIDDATDALEAPLAKVIEQAIPGLDAGTKAALAAHAARLALNAVDAAAVVIIGRAQKPNG